MFINFKLIICCTLKAQISTLSKRQHAWRKEEKRPESVHSKSKFVEKTNKHRLKNQSPVLKITNEQRKFEKVLKLTKEIHKDKRFESKHKMASQQKMSIIIDFICNILRIFGLQNFLFFK